jgi:hypothetical protein
MVEFIAHRLEDKAAGLAESDRGLSKGIRKGEMRNELRVIRKKKEARRLNIVCLGG